jgi:excisionase family DNA binding protein
MSLSAKIPDKAFLKTSEVAEILGANPSTVFSWVKKGMLRPVRTPGGTFRFARTDVEKLIGEYKDIQDDRRKEPRFKVNYPASIVVSQGDLANTFDVTIRDLSVSGMGLVAKTTGDMSSVLSIKKGETVLVVNPPKSTLRETIPADVRFVRKMNDLEIAIGLLVR